MKNVFERIIEGTLPSEKVYETDTILVIKDKYPKAAIHLLIIPKKKYINLQSVPEEDLFIMEEVIKTVQLMAKQFELQDSGYRLLVNNGEDAGQVIFHLHFHLLGGGLLGDIG